VTQQDWSKNDLCAQYMCPSDHCVQECEVNLPELARGVAPDNLNCLALCKNAKRLPWHPDFFKCEKGCRELAAELVRDPIEHPGNVCYSLCDLPNIVGDANTCYNNADWTFNHTHGYKVKPEFCEWAENRTHKPDYDKCYDGCQKMLAENAHKNPFPGETGNNRCFSWCNQTDQQKCHDDAFYQMNKVHDYNINPVFCDHAAIRPADMPDFNKCYSGCQKMLAENTHTNPFPGETGNNRCYKWCDQDDHKKCHDDAFYQMNKVHDYNINPVFCDYSKPKNPKTLII